MAHRWDGGREHLAPPALAANLSVREIEVLDLIRDDATNRQIAAVLGITEQTVKNHLSSINAKLGTQSRTGAVIKAIQAGFVALHQGTEPHPDGPSLYAAIDATRHRMERELDALVQAVMRMRRPD